MTLANALFSICVVYYIYNNPCNYQNIFAITFIRAFLDILDGSIARQCGEETYCGNVYDKTSDIIYAFCLLLVLVVQYAKQYKKEHIPVLIIFVVLVCMTWAETINKTPGYWQDNDLLLKPLVYSSFSYMAFRCKN